MSHENSSKITVDMSFRWRGGNEQEVKTSRANLERIFLEAQENGADVKFKNGNKRELALTAILMNMPVQMCYEDAEQLRALIRTMSERSPWEGERALEIIEAAILLR